MRPGALRFLEILGLLSIAITQPLLDVLGQRGFLFADAGIGRVGAVLFVIAVAVLPALAMWAVVQTADRLGAHERAVRALVAVAAGLVGFVVVGRLGVPRPVAWAAFPAAAALYFILSQRPAIKQWARIMSALGVLAVVLFAANVDVATSDPVDAQPTPTSIAPPPTLPDAPEAERPPSVVLIVFDELPTSSLLDGSGAVDAERFPNFGALAETSTFHRNYTTVSGWTSSSIPAMLTGVMPNNAPATADRQPDSVFDGLAPTHYLTVAEAVTTMCPCLASQPPPRAVVADGTPTTPSTTSTTSPPPPAPATDEDRGLAEVIGDSWDAWVDLLDGDTSNDAIFDDFEEEFVTITSPSTTEATASPTSTPSVVTQPPADPSAVPGTTDLVAQPSRMAEFLDAIVETDQPTFFYLHLILPHHPFNFLADGTRYESPGETESDVDDVRWETVGDARLALERHLEQTEYVDGLLGEIRDRLVATDNWDDSIVIVTADHGISFEPDGLGRTFAADTTAGEIMWVPMFWKEPGQAEARVDDTNLESIDLAPSILSEAGAPLLDQQDGVIRGTSEQQDRSNTKRYAQFRSFVVQVDDQVHTVDGDRWFDNGPPAASEAVTTLRRDAAGLDWMSLAEGEELGLVVEDPALTLLLGTAEPGTEFALRRAGSDVGFDVVRYLRDDPEAIAGFVPGNGVLEVAVIAP